MVGKKRRESFFWFGQHLFKMDFPSDWLCQLEKLNKSECNLNWFCCRSSALCALIVFCVLLECVTILYKDLFDNIIFLWFLMVLPGVTNFIEIDADRNQDGSLGCTY